MSKIPTEIRCTVKAWFTSSYQGPQDLAKDPADVIDFLGFYSGNMTGGGWSLAGEADITIRVLPLEQLIDAKVASLRSELTSVRVDATKRETEITTQINNLLAIGWAGEVNENVS